MAIGTITVTNLSSNQLSLDWYFADDRQVRQTLALGGSFDLGGLATIDEINRHSGIQALISAGTISVVSASGADDLPGVHSEEDMRARSGFPTLSWVDAGTTGLSLAGAPAAFTVVTQDLLQGGALATNVSGTGTSSVTVTANRPGTNGNLITVVLVDASSTAVAVSGAAIAGENTIARTITVDYRGPGNGNTDDADAVAALINGDSEASLLVSAVGGGAGNVTADAGFTLAGGTGTGFKVYVAGLEQNVNAALTDVLLSGETVDLTGLANTDLANLYVVSNGTQSMPIAVNIVT